MRGNTSAEARTLQPFQLRCAQPKPWAAPARGISVTTSYDGYGRLTGCTRTPGQGPGQASDTAQTNLYNGMDDRVAVTSGGTTRRLLA